MSAGGDNWRDEPESEPNQNQKHAVDGSECRKGKFRGSTRGRQGIYLSRRFVQKDSVLTPKQRITGNICWTKKKH